MNSSAEEAATVTKSPIGLATTPREYVSAQPANPGVVANALGPSRNIRVRRWHANRMPTGLIGVDILSLILAAILAEFAWEVGLMAVPMVLLLNALSGLYRPRLNLSVLDDVPTVIGRGFVAITLTSAVVSLGGWLSPLELGAGLLLTVASYSLLALCGRGVVYALVRRARAGGGVTHRTLVIGTGRVPQQLMSSLLQHPEYGLCPVGILDCDASTVGQLRQPAPGSTQDLAEAISSYRVDHVFIAFDGSTDADMVQAIQTSMRMACEVFVVPRVSELTLLPGPAVDDVFGIPCMHLRNRSRRSPGWLVKRALDVVAAALAVVLTSPVLIACALAVRWETGPGVLFRQKRIGLNGEEFTLLKFRTLKPTTQEESDRTWSIAHDDRLGNVGRFLRKTSLDELPQLWNVIVGEMSLVGPRPERPHFVSEFAEAVSGYTDRHRMPVGITGWAQIHGLRGDTSIEDRVRFDNQYIERWSLWRDIKIILCTVASLRRPSGE